MDNNIDKELIKTLNYSIREIREHDYKTRKQVFKGYRAEIPVVIKTPTDYDKNDKIFEIIINNFNADFNLNFALTPEQIETAKQELISLAVEDAKEKATAIVQSAGVELGEISKIQYGEPRTIRNFTHANYDLLNSGQLVGISAESSRGITKTLKPAEIEMRTNIMIAWEIED